MDVDATRANELNTATFVITSVAEKEKELAARKHRETRLNVSRHSTDESLRFPCPTSPACTNCYRVSFDVMPVIGSIGRSNEQLSNPKIILELAKAYIKS